MMLPLDTLIPVLFLFVLGLFFGSFFNVIADRSVKGESFIKGRSKCDGCGRVLGVKDLIPLLSFLHYRGVCTKCGVKLSFWYPLSELLTGMMFAFAFVLADGVNLQLTYLLVAFSFFIILFLADAKYYLVPSKIVFAAIGVLFIFITLFSLVTLIEERAFMSESGMGKYLIQAGYWDTRLRYIISDYGWRLGSALGIGFFFWFLVFITKGKGMGEGDISLGVMVGLFNPFPVNVFGVFLAFVIGSLYSIPLLIMKKKSIKSAIPFGPFIILGSLVSFVVGGKLLKSYLGLL